MTMPTPQTMLYKAPGPHQFADGDFDYIVVDDDKIEETLAQGWFLTTGEAQAALKAQRSPAPAPAPADTAPPTRAELEQKAKELGIEFDGRTSDKKLGERIAEKLRA